METNTTSRLRIAGMFCTKYSFILGSLILLLFCLTGAEIFRIIGAIFLIGAVGINFLVLFILFINLLIYPKYYLEILKTAALMMLNIPVAIFYVWLAQQYQSLPF